MPLLCKQRALYVKACVIANGVMDSQGDTLYSEDIKKIFTSFNNQDNFELNHDDIPIEEVSLLENYICPVDETIGTSIVPAGSWMAVIRVDDPEIQEGLLNGEFKGVSLSNRIADKCKANLHGTIRYKDIAGGECVIPRFISFVKGGANGYGLHVMDYEAYIKKSKDIEINERSDKKMAFDLLGGLKKLVQQAEADNEPVILKEDSEKEEEPVVEEPTTETESSEDEPTIKKEDKEAESEEDEKEKEDDEEDPSIEKDDETEPESVDDFEARVTAIVKKVLAELEAEDEETDDDEDESESEDEDTPKIVKSRKVIDDTPGETIQNTNYYTMSGRDPVTGKAIRK